MSSLLLSQRGFVRLRCAEPPLNNADANRPQFQVNTDTRESLYVEEMTVAAGLGAVDAWYRQYGLLLEGPLETTPFITAGHDLLIPLFGEARASAWRSGERPRAPITLGPQLGLPRGEKALAVTVAPNCWRRYELSEGALAILVVDHLVLRQDAESLWEAQCTPPSIDHAEAEICLKTCVCEILGPTHLTSTSITTEIRLPLE